MDDPLSAVDANVGKDLFYNVISNSGMLKNKVKLYGGLHHDVILAS